MGVFGFSVQTFEEDDAHIDAVGQSELKLLVPGDRIFNLCQ